MAKETGKLTSSGVEEIQASAETLHEGGRLFGELEQAVGHVEGKGEAVYRLAEETAKQAADVKNELMLEDE